jgi:hypothetical protein
MAEGIALNRREPQCRKKLHKRPHTNVKVDQHIQIAPGYLGDQTLIMAAIFEKEVRMTLNLP